MRLSRLCFRYYTDICDWRSRSTIEGDLSNRFEAQLKVIEVAQAGVTGAQLDGVARDFITEAGYGEAFGHSTGHGIGMEIHEGPNISRSNDKPLNVGNIITDEPGIYLAGLGGVRIEDDLVILAEGNRILTRSPKELIIL